MTLTLRELRVRAVDVPMARPLQTAVGVIPSTPLALIDLVSEEGVTGTTYVFCYSRPGLAAVVATLRELGPWSCPTSPGSDAGAGRGRALQRVSRPASMTNSVPVR